MEFTYDPRYNVAYIRFADKIGHVISHPLNDEIIVDVDANGKVYGIEFLNAREQLQLSNGKLAFFNEETQERREFPLPVS